MNRAVAMVYLTVNVSQEAMSGAIDPDGIMRHYVEAALRGMPERIYAVRNRLVIALAEPPWALYDIAQGGSYVDPLAMDVYSIRLTSTNLKALDPVEHQYAQSIVDNIPEGGMLPGDFAAYLSADQDVLTGKDIKRVMDILARHDANILPGDRARAMLGVPARTPLDFYDDAMKRGKS